MKKTNDTPHPGGIGDWATSLSDEIGSVVDDQHDLFGLQVLAASAALKLVPRSAQSHTRMLNLGIGASRGRAAAMIYNHLPAGDTRAPAMAEALAALFWESIDLALESAAPANNETLDQLKRRVELQIVDGLVDLTLVLFKATEFVGEERSKAVERLLTLWIYCNAIAGDTHGVTRPDSRLDHFHEARIAERAIEVSMRLQTVLMDLDGDAQTES